MFQPQTGSKQTPKAMTSSKIQQKAKVYPPNAAPISKRKGEMITVDTRPTQIMYVQWYEYMIWIWYELLYMNIQQRLLQVYCLYIYAYTIMGLMMVDLLNVFTTKVIYCTVQWVGYPPKTSWGDKKWKLVFRGLPKRTLGSVCMSIKTINSLDYYCLK